MRNTLVGATLLLIGLACVLFGGYTLVTEGFLRVLSLPAGEFHAQFGKALNLKCEHPCAAEQARYLWTWGIVGFMPIIIGLPLMYVGILLQSPEARAAD